MYSNSVQVVPCNLQRGLAVAEWWKLKFCYLLVSEAEAMQEIMAPQPEMDSDTTHTIA